jgi:hypothetical protein
MTTRAPDATYGPNGYTSQSISEPTNQPGVSAALAAAVGAPAGPQGEQGIQGVPGLDGNPGSTGPAGPSVVPHGATGARTASPATGAVFLDTTLDKPVFWNGTAWIDSTGATV